MVKQLPFVRQSKINKVTKLWYQIKNFMRIIGLTLYGPNSFFVVFGT